MEILSGKGLSGKVRDLRSTISCMALSLGAGLEICPGFW